VRRPDLHHDPAPATNRLGGALLVTAIGLLLAVAALFATFPPSGMLVPVLVGGEIGSGAVAPRRPSHRGRTR
jgi:hypothetical protein